MKNIVYLLIFPVAALLLTGFTNHEIQTPAKGGEGSLKFQTLTYDFGQIKQGDIASCTFSFTNTGKAPVIIQYVEKACGCMEPVWPKEPVMPGKSAEIKVSYTTKSRPGEFRKTMTVKTANGENALLMIKGNVVPEKELQKN